VHSIPSTQYRRTISAILRDILIFGRRLVNDDFNLVQLAECRLDLRTHIVPIESAIATTGRWQGDRVNFLFANNVLERGKAGLNPFELRGLTPMFLRREINDPTRAVQLNAGLHGHPAHVHFARLARGFVGLEILRETFFEHQGNAFAHDSDRVHGIDDRVHAGIEQVTLSETHHEWFASPVPIQSLGRLLADSTFNYGRRRSPSGKSWLHRFECVSFPLPL